MRKRMKSSRLLNLWLNGIMVFCAFFAFSCAGDDDGDEFLNLGEPSLDSNYWDYGMVNVTGSTITTKIRTILPSPWQDKAPYSSGPGGVRIDDYMFYLDTGSRGVLTVKNIKSGVAKDLSGKSDHYRQLIGADRLKGRDIWTVLRGFLDVETGEDENATHGESYRLLVRSGFGTIKYFEMNVVDAFEKGKELAIKPIHQVQFPGHHGLISLIRVPSLEPNPQSENFGCNDFAAVVHAHHNDDRHLITRYVQFDPYLVNIHQPLHTWMYQPVTKYETGNTFGAKEKTKYVGNLSNISATTKIDADGNYCVVIASTCWANEHSKPHQCYYYSFVGSNLAEFVVTYDYDKRTYGLTLKRQMNNYMWVKYRQCNRFPPTFDASHYTILATFAEEIAGRNIAPQAVAAIATEKRFKDDKEYEAFVVRKVFSRDAVFDWNRDVLDQYGIDPEVNLDEAQKRTGEGHIVQGMVLSVPPNKGYADKFRPIGEKVDPYANASFTNTITSTITSGTKNSVGSKVDAHLGGIVSFPFFALSASKASSYTQDTQETTRLSYQSDWFLEDFRGNLIITLEPRITLKCSVLQGAGTSGFQPRANVKYYNQPMTEKAYAITTAVMGKKSVFDYYYGITDQPGYSLNKQEQEPLKTLVLTQGMTPYRVDQTETGSNYMNIINSLKYFSSEVTGKIITLIAEGNSWVGSDAGSSSKIEILESMKETTKTTQSWSGSMTAGKFGVISVRATVNGEFSVYLENSYENTVGWIVKYIRELTDKGVYKVIPDVYWIPVSALKAKYGSREPSGVPGNLNLKFIPDYMWNNSMDYWLLAYPDLKVEAY